MSEILSVNYQRHEPRVAQHQKPEEPEEYEWTLRFYKGRVLLGEVTLPSCTQAEARTYAQNSIRKPITGTLLKRRGEVLRFGTSVLQETW